MYLAAVVQLSSSADGAGNLARAEELVRRAAGYGARLVATPENTNFLGPQPAKVASAESLDGAVCSRFSSLAAELGIHLLLGSFNEVGPQPGRCYNTSVLYGPDGTRLAVYRKIHLFDVDVSSQVRFRESDTVAVGRDPVVVATPRGRVGLSICYDLRFPELYRRLIEKGAELLLAPSAFTATTGKAHWELLVRARAVDSQCYVLAPAQCGRHDDDGIRESHGHSMIVDPWGEILAGVADRPGLAVAEIDLERVAAVRRMIPVAASRASREVPEI